MRERPEFSAARPLPHLYRHDVVGLTRSREKLKLIGDLGAEAVLCDVYDYETLLRITQRVRPSIVINFLTDLSAGSAEANNRVRRDGGANLLNAATATNASRLVIESVAFALDGDAAAALEQLERSAREFPREALSCASAASGDQARRTERREGAGMLVHAPL